MDDSRNGATAKLAGWRCTDFPLSPLCPHLLSSSPFASIRHTHLFITPSQPCPPKRTPLPPPPPPPPLQRVADRHKVVGIQQFPIPKAAPHLLYLPQRVPALSLPVCSHCSQQKTLTISSLPIFLSASSVWSPLHLPLPHQSDSGVTQAEWANKPSGERRGRRTSTEGNS
ncbi:unnamed protein product [Pleuronectes platessa]|uniref:Uncharacterized protein n=1 Tax=Pleuronectes platessa TaxID=8262 RepID=A0A9N7VJV5_PLEPL|nr:unnamed protein product [Pleuronectes platessa]